MAEENKALIKSSIALTRFDTKARKELVVRGLIALAEVKDADFYFFHGEDHRIRGELRQALDNYEQALRIDPNHVDSLFSMGHCYLDVDEPQYKKAAEVFQGLINVREKKGNLSRYDFLMYFNLGVAQRNLGLYEEAIGSYERAIELDPGCAPSYCALGLAQYGLGLHEEAIESCKQAIELDPEYARSYHNLGLAQYGLGLYEEAIGSNERAIELDPENALSYCNLGLCQEKTGLEHLALENFEKYLSLDGNKIPSSVEYAKRRVIELRGRKSSN